MSRRFDPTLVVLAVALPALLVLGAVIPPWLVFYLQVSLAGGLSVLAVVVQMRAGLVSFGQGLYHCLGAYAAGMSGHFLGLTDAFLLVGLGAFCGAAVALALGFLMARYREIFFAMLSLAFSMLLYGLLVRAEALGSTDGFNLPPTTFLGWAPEGPAARDASFVLVVVVVVLAAAALQRLLGAPLGALAQAIRENEIRVEYLGASPRLAVHALYVIAGIAAGVGGALTAITVGHVEPDLAYWTTSGRFVFVALLSGTGNVVAPLVGAFLLELVRIYAVEYAPYTWQMILGGVMLLVILFLPGGLWSLVHLGGRGST